MAVCDKKSRKKTSVCIGSLNKKVKIYLRSIKAPVGSEVDFSEEFQEEREVWAMIDTITGVTEFDSVNTEKVVTHDIYIRYIPSITFEKWLEMKIDGISKYLDIVRVQNYQENNDFYRLRCSLRGDTSKPANEA